MNSATGREEKEPEALEEGHHSEYVQARVLSGKGPVARNDCVVPSLKLHCTEHIAECL